MWKLVCGRRSFLTMFGVVILFAVIPFTQWQYVKKCTTVHQDDYSDDDDDDGKNDNTHANADGIVRCLIVVQ